MKTANQNQKLNRAVQGMLFGMAERGMGAAVMRDKGKQRNARSGEIDEISLATDELVEYVNRDRK